MLEILKTDSIPKGLAILSGLMSIGLFIYGFNSQLYWSGFALILFMPSLLIAMSLTKFK